MRPSLQKTLMLALGAALVTSALGTNGGNATLQPTRAPVKLVVLPRAGEALIGADLAARASDEGFAALLRKVRLQKAVDQMRAVQAEALPAYSREDLVARVRSRMEFEQAGSNP